VVRYVVQRVVWAFLLLWLVTLITFSLTHIVPNDPAGFMAGFGGTKETIEAIRKDMGLDKPLTTQYLVYLEGLVQLDFGTSLRTQRPVSEDVSNSLPASLELGILSFALYAILAIALGSFAAAHRGRVVDGVLRVLAVIGSGLPVFWVALLFQELFFANLGWFPYGGRLDIGAQPPPQIIGFFTVDALLTAHWSVLGSALLHLALPVMTIVLTMLAVGLRSTRASVLSELISPYVTTARAKGLRERRVYLGHVLRNSLNPVVSIMSIQAGHLLGWIVLVETIFDWPGIGLYTYESVQSLDYAPIMALTLILSFAFIVINLITDLVYPILDPRVRVQ
jgi:ABC-type dipeptide/oligopeptide/nickel transport system permease component